MTYLQTLWRVELSALAALVICACIMALGGLAQSFWWLASGKSLLLSPAATTWLSFAYTGTLGLLPVILYGAPTYAFLRYKGRASWLVVFFVGFVPGAGLFLLYTQDRSLGSLFMLCGVATAYITHFLMSRSITVSPGSNTALNPDAQKRRAG